MSERRSGNVSRFVRSARTLLAFQMAAASGAAIVTAWAAVEVQGLIEERDRLADQVAQLKAEAQPPLTDPAGETVAGPEIAPPAPRVDEPAPAEDGRDAADNIVTPPPLGVPTPTPVPPSPPPAACRNVGGSPLECVPPFQRIEDSTLCIDGDKRRMLCPPGVPDATPPPTPTPPPPPARDCSNLFDKAVRCVPPYRAGPLPGICYDGRLRLIKCPPGQPPQTGHEQNEQRDKPNQRPD